MGKKYRSPYEAYPFLCDDAADLRCDFELLTDEMSSQTGLLRAKLLEKGYNQPAALAEDLCWIAEMIYHLNPSLRTKYTITDEECEKLKSMVGELKEKTEHRCNKFVLPVGGTLGCEAHLLRVKGKCLVRMVYRHCENGNEVPDALLDFANLLSGYFFFLAMYLNEMEGVEEIPFVSRNYK